MTLAVLIPVLIGAYWLGRRAGEMSRPAVSLRVEPTLQVGDPIPSAIVHDDGIALPLTSLTSGRVVLLVASVGCDQCLADIVVWNEIADGYPDLKLVALACGPRPDELALIRQRGKPTFATYYCDSFTIQKLKVSRTPTIYVANEGVIEFAADGIDATRALQAFISSAPPPVP